MTELRLLLVEDEDDLRLLIGEALRMVGHDVVAVSDGPQAVQALQDGMFDVVVSDVSMPNGMTGIELVDHTARLQPEAHVVLASGFARAQLPPLPPQVTFLPKPYRIPQLLSLLQRTAATPRAE